MAAGWGADADTVIVGAVTLPLHKTVTLSLSVPLLCRYTRPLLCRYTRLNASMLCRSFRDSGGYRAAVVLQLLVSGYGAPPATHAPPCAYDAGWENIQASTRQSTVLSVFHVRKGGSYYVQAPFSSDYFRFRCDSSHGRTLERARVSSRSHFIPHPSQHLSCIFRTPPYPSALSPRVLFSLSSTHTQHRHVVLRSPNKRGGFRYMSAEIC